jgi:hypothetical protein
MPTNSVALAKKYTSLVDEKYQAESKTSDLASPMSMAKAGANANEILVRKISLLGLGDYSRNSGYTNNKVTVAWETMQFNYDRGTKIELDTQDNEETMEDTFLIVQNELQTEYVAPEGDAFKFSSFAQKNGISKVEGTIADASAFLTALITATTKMDEDKVPATGRILYATPTLLNSVMGLDTTKSREVLARFSKVVSVPQDRFYTKVTLQSNAEEEEFGYAKAGDDAYIKFMIVHKPAVIVYDKHIVSDTIPAALNDSADADISKYRKYGLVYVYDNKVAGIYLHAKAVSASI